jgi:predicted O-methyltransferase YrrM
MDRTKFIQDLRQFGIENTVPNISDTNAAFIIDLLKISKSKKMLEI